MAKKSIPKNVAVIQVESCLECPHHGYERDPSSDDSFDWFDESLVCRKARAPKAEYEREKRGLPDWCPLLKKGRK